MLLFFFQARARTFGVARTLRKLTRSSGTDFSSPPLSLLQGIQLFFRTCISALTCGFSSASPFVFLCVHGWAHTCHFLHSGRQTTSTVLLCSCFDGFAHVLLCFSSPLFLSFLFHFLVAPGSPALTDCRLSLFVFFFFFYKLPRSAIFARNKPRSPRVRAARPSAADS